MSLSKHPEQLSAQFGPLLSAPVVFRGETTMVLSDPERIEEVCRFAKQTLGYDLLLDISSIDHYGAHPRWTIVYELAGLAHGGHLRLKTHVSEESSQLPTVITVWRTADWHEREIFDMMGIRFRGHPDLRRILMWEGYPHHPLRKDFPLSGKSTDVPEVAFSQPAPLEGGPFVTEAGAQGSLRREPRSRTADS